MPPRATAGAGLLLAVLALADVARPEEGTPPCSTRGRPASHHTATGTMKAYDPLTRVLTVTSASGSLEFDVAADARFWLGNRRLPVGQLGAHTGAQVTVAWSASDGVRTTHTVRVADSRAVRAQ